jgi:cytochrome c
LALGRHLAGECSTCHPRDNRAAGIPGIIGWPPDQFVAVLQSYKAKERDNQIMQSVASSLSDDEMAALAEYFAALKPGG